MSLMNIDYERDLRQAQKLQSYADNECATILNKLQTARDALGQCWKGNSGTAMQEVLEERIQNMKNIQSDMRSLASRLRRAVIEVKNADERTAAAIKSAFGGGSGSFGGGTMGGR